MTTDIVDRLKAVPGGTSAYSICREAAAEIERLRAENERTWRKKEALRTALLTISSIPVPKDPAKPLRRIALDALIVDKGIVKNDPPSSDDSRDQSSTDHSV